MEKYLMVALLISTMAYSKSFTSEFLEFQLPRGWECQLEGSEWVCQSSVDQKKKEAIIILAAKKRGPQDELDKYEAYLKKSKSFALPGGKTQVSEVVYVKQKVIKTQDHRWVDAEHLASEVPGFYTRYLATVKGNLGVAITFSVAKDVRAEYRELFDSVVETLKVFDRTGNGNGSYNLGKRNKGLVPGADGNWDEGALGIDTQVNNNLGDGGKKPGDDSTLYLIIGAVVVGGLLLAKKGKKKPSKKKKKKKRKKKS
ncbi:MAG: hypothetical protein CME69_06540 [Halobacteriovorax sp.]|nr:hypothetical protein [Halobacteriovorax sp.]